jgi:hypothetical protein
MSETVEKPRHAFLSLDELARRLEAAPAEIRALPIHRGYPVPFFVERPKGWAEGDPIDFRVTSPQAMLRAVYQRLCWISGTPLGRTAVFVGGPTSAITRTWAEPPSRMRCAQWAARVCPFMLGTGGLPPVAPGAVEMPGRHVSTNSGVMALVATAHQWAIKPHGNGVVFSLTSDPVDVVWFKAGRPATKDEVWAALDAAHEVIGGMSIPDNLQRPFAVSEMFLRAHAARTL